MEQKQQKFTYHSPTEAQKLSVLLASEINEEAILERSNDLKIDSPNRKYFRELLEQNPGFQTWAETNTPYNESTGEKFEFSPEEVAFLALSKDNFDMSKLDHSVTQALKYHLKYNSSLFMESNFFCLRQFGYPIVFVSESFWRDKNAQALHFNFGLIIVRNTTTIEQAKYVIIHEITHAINNYKKIAENQETSISKWEKVEDLASYKRQALKVFKEEIQAYYTHRDLANYETLYLNEEKFLRAYTQINLNPKKNQEILSLSEIEKRYPDFGSEIRKTFIFWRYTLYESSPEQIEALIKFVQSAQSFDEISINNLENIRKATQVSPFLKKVNWFF